MAAETGATIARFFTPGLAQVAYLVADEAAGVAAVIDPRRDVAAYLDWTAVRRLRITAILETHIHADFVSGARELAAATGAPIHTGALGNQEFPHEPLSDGDEVPVGAVRLRALWTPGHTPEHLAYLLLDPATGPGPRARVTTAQGHDVPRGGRGQATDAGGDRRRERGISSPGA